MSDIPEYEEAVVTFIDKPQLLTMLSGGFFMSLFLYFVFQRVTQNLDFPGSGFFPIGVALLIILLSIVRARAIDVKITINTKSGWVHGSNRSQYWEGYIHDAEKIIVLQREQSVNETTSYIEYKLILELDDDSSYEILLNTDQARKAIETIDQAKAAVPLKSDQPSK